MRLINNLILATSLVLTSCGTNQTGYSIWGNRVLTNHNAKQPGALSAPFSFSRYNRLVGFVSGKEKRRLKRKYC